MKLEYSDTESHTETEELYLKLKSISSSIRESADDRENAEKAFNIHQHLLVGKIEADPTRRFVAEGPLDYNENDFRRAGYVTIFNDILVLSAHSIFVTVRIAEL
jgi:hypothetical protein